MFFHDDPDDRPAEIFSARVTIYTGGATPSHLLLPVIPSVEQTDARGTDS